ncbi:YciI family protein [Streptosporangium sp. NPDC051023]|uniref:YciI family protein n=1 Tax=Streptosporangium sp. NPDC051023 TaxID=3155410 RepID=UPI00344C1A67
MMVIYMNSTTWDTLSEQERDEVLEGHDIFVKTITESGEMVSSEALADPATSVTVRVRDGIPASTDGPYTESKEFFRGYYMVDCDSVGRAIELAAMIPDARHTGIEVRPLMDQA